MPTNRFINNFERMLYRSSGGIGRWVIVRHFDKKKRSKYWNDETKEAVGGPPFEYTDSIVLASKQLAFQPTRPATRAGVTLMEQTGVVLENFRYFIPANVTIEEDDELFDTSYTGSKKPTIIDYTATGKGNAIVGRYKVKLVNDNVVGDRGLIGYSLVIADKIYTE